MKRVLCAVTFSLGLASSIGMASEVTIGRWCDAFAPSVNITQTIEFVTSSNKSLTIRRSFSDGSGSETVLEELGNETYAEADASFGEKYRIVPSTGDLQLLDDDGLIRTAKRLENAPQEGECR
ncbi:hypothetical protein [uncultured Paracoccus sp.]|uniref:hypothetical protein n=1 Tax=uncultured Paracoccus sp. TaxID=189685 RepID=UPI0025FA21B0|nr:hypothetical protein [uncultured Paracoccus sp.]